MSYSHAPANYICPFCFLFEDINSKPLQSLHSDIIFHNSIVTAVVSAHQYPNNLGNVLIIPIEHVENIYSVPLELAPEIMKLTKAVALTMKQAWNCDGVTVRQNNEPAGGQDVWHFHIHITPRYENDNFYSTKRQLVSEQDRAKLADELRAPLKQTIQNIEQ